MPPDKEPSDSRPPVLHRMSGTERQVLDEVTRLQPAEVIVPELPFSPPPRQLPGVTWPSKMRRKRILKFQVHKRIPDFRRRDGQHKRHAGQRVFRQTFGEKIPHLRMAAGFRHPLEPPIDHSQAN